MAVVKMIKENNRKLLPFKVSYVYVGLLMLVFHYGNSRCGKHKWVFFILYAFADFHAFGE